MPRYRPLCIFAILVGIVALAPPPATPQTTASFDSSLFNAMRYRCIGPFRGGRAAAVTGLPGNPMTFFFGGTGGGVWRSDNGGQTWSSMSDGFFGGSIGAVAISDVDHNVMYVGGGECTVRGNVSHGDGVWKSLDGGKTWKHMGLDDTRQIPRIRIDPRNPDRLYVAALGHLYGPNGQRGIFRSTDGGTTWKRVLFVNNDVGAADLALDPNNPRVLFASMWRVRRTPWSFSSGGEGSGLWKSEDGGDTWKDITRNEGLPAGTLGIIGVAVSSAKPGRVWAIVEADEGGVFRSDNGGATWSKVNDERKLRQRAWYYSRIYADPVNEDKVYVVNVAFWRSKDGGKTFQNIGTPHGDHHDLWIDPEVPDRMIIGDDGGAQVTFNGGESWSTYHNQPTAQFYRVTTDTVFPYRIYGAQQDNSTIRIVHRSGGAVITERDWDVTAGGESGWLAPDPIDPDIVFGDSYHGLIEQWNHRTEQGRLVDVWPENMMGYGAKDARYRFQWNAPLLFSMHDPHALLAAGNVLFRSTDRGQHWAPMSGDLTRNDTSKLGPSGGPITKDNTGVEYYCTIFTVAESPVRPGIFWAGSDDGLIHVTSDNGATWRNVTPPAKLMPAWIQINAVEAHPTNPAAAYVAATMYKSDDFRPYLYKTTDFGATWTKIVNGIDRNHFTRVVRADPHKTGLLYAGTENGMYISFNDGEQWQPFQLNLPLVPVTDLAIRENDLIVATQGRSFWVLDDLTPLHQLSPRVVSSNAWLYTPRPAYAMDGGSVENPKTDGENPPSGVMVFYYLKTVPDSASVHLRILDAQGKEIASFSPKEKEEVRRMPVKQGMNRFVWNMRYPDADKFDNLIMWFGGTEGPGAVPGSYSARLVTGKDSMTVPFTILKDPRSPATQADLQLQFDFLLAIRDKLSETHKAIKTIREVRKQVNALTDRIGDRPGSDSIRAQGKILLESLKSVEEALYQTKNRSSQDPLNFPVRLNNQLATVGAQASYGHWRPTDQAVAVKQRVVAEIDVQLQQLQRILDKDVPSFNALVRTSDIPAVVVDMPESAAHRGTQ